MGSEEARLARIEAQQAEMITLIRTLTERVDKSIDAQEAWKDRIQATIYGNGTTPGIRVELALLKEAHRRGQWLMRVVVGTVATLTIGGLWSLLMK